ncbi:hypothetical protein TREES_T100009567 [Tupaia chinensis]|uniref:Uncharacterized protein n=1 Tax=Tupaia chinensis TaxID=246437 RepID=L9LCP1_TUPCH|nr:hypothetical protein TREES_T100009567 [Tupaia chinensis]
MSAQSHDLGDCSLFKQVRPTLRCVETVLLKLSLLIAGRIFPVTHWELLILAVSVSYVHFECPIPLVRELAVLLQP